ncbi:hypothetical protein L6452_34574 [Arctium lappa]|uniref:Uncharacterized protein n=1 Tax=Arctium lappa TaxID=4217 RepID=A0ACB8YJA6_ARCLA|nr:hypothetical protein L6452_34574 [Arctium lappa]
MYILMLLKVLVAEKPTGMGKKTDVSAGGTTNSIEPLQIFPSQRHMRPSPSRDWQAGNDLLGSLDPRIFSLENNFLLMLGRVLNLISRLPTLSM